MALIAEQLPSLMNGVSQQAVTMRMPSQAEAQINGLSSLVRGNTKRPPTKHTVKLFDGTAADAFIHTIKRDDEERYKLLIRDREIRVFGVDDGIERTVTYPDGTDYLASLDPQAEFRALTVADYTFIVNNTVEVAKTADLSQHDDRGAILFFKEASYETEYKVTIDGVEEAVYTTGDGVGTPVHIDDIVFEIESQLRASLSTTHDIVSSGPVLWIRRKDQQDFTIEFEDDDGSDYVDVIRGGVQRFTDLPVRCRRDFTVTITGDDESAFDEYYLKFVPDNPSLYFDDGVWQETVAPSVETTLDPATMPHVLVRQPDGTFEFRREDWGQRVVGDENSAPFPSFTGHKISGLYFDRRRLCFLSRGNVIMSKSGDFFNFMPETVLQVLDDGRIDVSVPGTEVATLDYAEPFNEKILFFSQDAQFMINDAALLASSPPALKKIGSHESNGKTDPVTSGRTLFFAVDRGDWSGVMEYFILPETETTDAADITEHVPRYMPASVVSMAASPTARVVLALSSGQRDRVWVYKHHWQGNKKLQSSWSIWQFDSEASIQDVDFINDQAQFVVDYPDGVYLETLDVTDGQYDEGETYVCRLDRRVTEAEFVSVSYDNVTDQTTVVLPYQTNSDNLTIATRSANGTSDRPAGQSVLILSRTNGASGHTVVLSGDYSATKLFAGLTYSHVYTFSEAVVKDNQRYGGQASILAGRLQVLRWLVHVENTGYFRVEVLPYGRTKPFVKHITGTTLGTPHSTVGELSLRSGTVPFRVNSRSDRVTISLVNDSFLPSAFTAAEWEGRFTRNTSRP